MAQAKPKAKPRPRRAAPPVVLPPRWWAWALVLLLLAAAAVLQVRTRVAAVQLGYALSEAAAEGRALQAEHRKLLVEVATLRSPRRLRRLAVEQLGMVEPTTARVLRSDDCDRGELALRPER